MLVVTRSGKHIDLLSEGEFFGEMALVDGSPRSADVHVQEAAELVKLPAPAYQSLKRERPASALKMADVMLKQLSFRVRRSTSRALDAEKTACPGNRRLRRPRANARGVGRAETESQAQIRTQIQASKVKPKAKPKAQRRQAQIPPPPQRAGLEQEHRRVPRPRRPPGPRRRRCTFPVRLRPHAGPSWRKPSPVPPAGLLRAAAAGADGRRPVARKGSLLLAWPPGQARGPSPGRLLHRPSLASEVWAGESGAPKDSSAAAEAVRTGQPSCAGRAPLATAWRCPWRYRGEEPWARPCCSRGTAFQPGRGALAALAAAEQGLSRVLKAFQSVSRHRQAERRLQAIVAAAAAVQRDRALGSVLARIIREAEALLDAEAAPACSCWRTTAACWAPAATGRGRDPAEGPAPGQRRGRGGLGG